MSSVPAVHAQQAPASTTPIVRPLAALIKYLQTHVAVLFNKRGNMSQILAQITTQIIFGPPYF